MTSGIKLDAFEYIPPYLSDLPMEYKHSIEAYRYRFPTGDESIVKSTMLSTSLNVLERMTPIIDEPSKKPSMLSGETYTRVGISPVDRKPRFALSLAVWGNLFFGTQFGFHRLSRPGRQTGHFGRKRRVFLVWDVSWSNNGNLNIHEGRPFLYLGETSEGDGREKYETGFMAMMMLLQNAIEGDVLVNTYIFPARVGWEMANRRSKYGREDTEKVKVPDWRHSVRDGKVFEVDVRKDAKDSQTGGYENTGICPELNMIDEDARVVMKTIANLNQLTKRNYIMTEQFGSVAAKLYADVMRREVRDKEGIVMLTDVDSEHFITRTESYMEWAWISYYLKKRANFFIVIFTKTAGTGDMFLGVFPGEYSVDLTTFGRYDSELNETIMDYIVERSRLDRDKITPAMIGRYRVEFLENEIRNLATMIALEGGVSEGDIFDKNGNVIDSVLKNRLVPADDYRFGDVYSTTNVEEAFTILPDTRRLLSEGEINEEFRVDFNKRMAEFELRERFQYSSHEISDSLIEEYTKKHGVREGDVIHEYDGLYYIKPYNGVLYSVDVNSGKTLFYPRLLLHPWNLALERVLQPLMEIEIATERYALRELMRKFNIPGSLSSENRRALKERLAKEYRQLTDDLQTVYTWDLSSELRNVGNREGLLELRRNHKRLYANYIEVNDTNAKSVISSLLDMQPSSDESKQEFYTIAQHRLDPQVVERWRRSKGIPPSS